jgi:ADP-ribose pyrophosphatase YjhB (NUDIX family)
MIKHESTSKKELNYCPICGEKLRLDSIEGKNRRNCHSCGFVDYKNPLPCVSIIGIKEDKIALIKRGIEPSKGSWAPPSGFMEAGEKPEETALRELYEETSLRGEVKELLGIHTHDVEIYGSLVIIIFLVRITGGDIKAGDDALDAKFFKLEEIPEMNHDFYNDAIEKAKNLIKKRYKSK